MMNKSKDYSNHLNSRSFDDQDTLSHLNTGLVCYSNHLNTGLVWYSNGSFVSGCQTVRYLNGGLKTGLKKPVYGPKCLVFKWSAKSCDFTI